jgi:hypothetical protein
LVLLTVNLSAVSSSASPFGVLVLPLIKHGLNTKTGILSFD